MDDQHPDAHHRPWNYEDAVGLTFLLYLCGYGGGLIDNIWFLMQASRYAQHTGEKPRGIGCLWAMLLLALIPVIVVVVQVLTGALFADGEYTFESLRRTFNF